MTSKTHALMLGDDWEEVMKLVQSAPPSESELYNLLCLAIEYNGPVALIQKILDTSSAVDLDSPLLRACAAERMDVAELLLERGANPDYDNAFRINPLRLCCFGRDMTSLVPRLIERYGANIDAQIEHSGTSVLHSSCLQPDFFPLVQLLVELGASVDLQDKQGRTPLMLASANGALESARFLLKHGACVNATCTNKQGSVLHHAFENAFEPAVLAMCQLLVEHGADVNCKAKGEVTVMQLASGRGFNQVCNFLREKGASEVKEC